MTQPRFSIVIPTRNRAGTLPSSIETVTAQSFEDWELIVFDNASTDETGAICGQFSDPRIKYFRRDRPVPMTQNWNEALAKTTGDWIMFIGDDDGIIPRGLESLARSADEYDVQSIRWDFAVYTWPNEGHGGRANLLSVPLSKPTQLVRAADRLSGMLANGAGKIVPHTYHAAMRRDLVNRVLESGAFFEGPCPDLVSGVLSANFTEYFLELDEPISLVGYSPSSNTITRGSLDNSKETWQDFERLNSQSGIRVHPDLPNLIELGPIAQWDSLFRARDRLGLGPETTAVSPNVIAQSALDAIELDGESRALQTAAILDWWDANKAGSNFELRIPDPDAGSELTPVTGTPGLHPTDVVLDGAEYGCQTIADACVLARDVLRLKPTFVSLNAQVESTKKAAAEVGRLEVQRERERAVDELRSTQKKLKARIRAQADEIRALQRTPTQRLRRKAKSLLTR